MPAALAASAGSSALEVLGPERPLDDLSDNALALHAKDGSVAAYNILIVRYQDRVYRFLLRRTGSPAEAEDVAQETFLRAWQKLHTFEAERPLAPWLLTIAARLAASAARRRGRLRMVPESSTGFIEAASDDAGQPDLDLAGRRHRVWAIADRVLNREQMTAIWLRYVEGLSPAQIARVMEKSGVAVRVMLLRARNTLAEAIREQAADLAQARPTDEAPVAGADSRAPGVTLGLSAANTRQG